MIYLHKYLFEREQSLRVIGCRSVWTKTILAYPDLFRAQWGTRIWPSFDLTYSAGLGLHLKITRYVLCWNLSDIPCGRETCLLWWARAVLSGYRGSWGPLACLGTILYISTNFFSEVGCTILYLDLLKAKISLINWQMRWMRVLGVALFCKSYLINS